MITAISKCGLADKLMLRRLTLVLPLLVFALSHVAAARARGQSVNSSNKSRPANKDSVRLRARGRRIVLTAGGRTQTLDLGDKLSAARLETVELLFVTRRADFVYLFADARGWSKLRQDDHQCGAGEEYDLVWMKLTPDWHLVESRSARYESCWGSTTSDDGYKIEKNTLRIAYSDFQRKLECVLTYDADQPERGFTLEESAMKDSTPDLV